MPGRGGAGARRPRPRCSRGDELRAAPRRPVHDQGLVRHGRGPHHPGLPASSRTTCPAATQWCHAAGRGGRNPARQDEPAGLRALVGDRQPRLRAHASTRGISSAAPAARAGARPRRSPPASRRSGSAATSAARSGCRPHYCGVVGLKPTHGRVPGTGHWPDTLLRFMHVGFLGRSVEDVALALSLTAGPDGEDPYASAGAGSPAPRGRPPPCRFASGS